jgi:hypothetical protein
MKSKRALRVPASLDVIPFARAVEDPDQLHCPDCGKPLETHQPDVDSPDRLVGTCPGCRRWYLVFSDAGGADVVMVLLPDREWVRVIALVDGSAASAEPE